ncbi:MAG: hypothetical protein K9L86_00620 [Candidatus Omnitrophica bacterium]|nr:hypothetical protein [Candidatus Omnitrophota bacterium]
MIRTMETLCFAALIFAITFAFTPLALAYDLSKYYPLNEGDSWEYLTSGIGYVEGGADKAEFSDMIEVDKIESKESISGKRTMVKVSGALEEKECLAVDSEGLKLYKLIDGPGGYDIFTPPFMQLANLAVGESKTFLSNAIGYGDRSSEGARLNTNTITLESVERVEVPAGLFDDCLKFTSTGERAYADGNYENIESTVWLALGVGVVKADYIYIEHDFSSGEDSTTTNKRNLVSAKVNGQQIGTPKESQE